MTVHTELARRIEAAIGDVELLRLSPGLSATVALAAPDGTVFVRFAGGAVTLGGPADAPADITVSAECDIWTKVLLSPPPPHFHSFTAWQIANPAFSVTGEPIRIAQARAALERLVELIVGEAGPTQTTVRRDPSQITGRYHRITIAGDAFDVFCEEAGTGVPVLLLHTAGADGRQFLGQTSDVELAARYRMYALDLPFHGRSLPPPDWCGGPYRLTAATYRDWCAAFIEQVVGEKVILVGCSMGAAMALVMAAERPDLLRGAIALEPPFRSPGRRNPHQNHVEVHGGLHNGSFVRGLMSPTSPIDCRRRAAWIYSQGAPGIYPGDLAFYSDEFDGAVVAPKVDASRTPIALLSGVYDYSATPADGAKLAELIPHARHVIMDGLGHFPMTENPDGFRPHFFEALGHMAS